MALNIGSVRKIFLLDAPTGFSDFRGKITTEISWNLRQITMKILHHLIYEKQIIYANSFLMTQFELNNF